MKKETNIKLFEEKKVRTIWDEETEKWWFSVVDIIAVLTESDNPQVYWRVLKKRLIQEGNETVTNCNGLKLQAQDGKMRKADISVERQPVSFNESAQIAAEGATVAKVVREQIEKSTGKSTISSLNAKSKKILE